MNKINILFIALLTGCGTTSIPTSIEDYNEEQITREAKRLGMRPVDYLHQINNNKKPKWEGGVANDGSFEPKYQIRIKNDLADESLYYSPTLKEAKAYVAEYGMFHQDLFIYEVESYGEGIYNGIFKFNGDTGKLIEIHE